MRAAVVLLALVVASCVPAFVPAAGVAPGVTLTRAVEGELTVFTLAVEPAVDRAFLRFTGTGLAANAPGECTVTPTVIECVVGQVEAEYVITIAGIITNRTDRPFGIACRAECWSIFLTE